MIFRMIAGLGVVLAMLVSTAILIPTFLLRERLSTRPGEWWYFGISFAVGFLVLLALFSSGGGSRDTGFQIMIASAFGALMSVFGALWHKSGIGFLDTVPRSSAVARVILLMYLAAFIVFGAIAIHLFVGG